MKNNQINMKSTFILIVLCFVKFVTAQIENPISEFKNNPISYIQKEYRIYKEEGKILDKEQLNQSLNRKMFDVLKLETYKEATFTNYFLGMKSTFKSVGDSIQRKYDANHLLIEENELFKLNDSLYSLHKKNKFVYTKSKLLDSVKVYIDDFNQPKYIYTYNYNNNKIAVIQELTKQKLTEKIEFSYKNQQLTQNKRTVFTSYGGVTIPTTISTLYKYDKKGNIAEKTIINHEGEKAIDKYYYNTNGILLKKECFETYELFNEDTKQYKKTFGKVQTIEYKNYDAKENATKIVKETFLNGVTQYTEIERKFTYPEKQPN